MSRLLAKASINKDHRTAALLFKKRYDKILYQTDQLDFAMNINCYQLDHLSTIRVQGPQAQDFLQGQLTCDVNKISTTYSSLGAHCNLKGRMVSLFQLCQIANDYWLIMPRDIIDSALKHLARYAKFSKVTLSVEETIIIGIKGSPERISVLLNSKAALAPNNTASDDHTALMQVIGTKDRHVYLNTTNQLPPSLSTLPQNPAHDWQYDDIEQGLAFLTQTTIGKFIPNEIELDKLAGASFNKGCYLGQEIVARIHHLGQLKKKMILVEFENSNTQRESEIINHQGRVCGELICSTKTNQHRHIGLALIQNNHVNDSDLSFRNSTAIIQTRKPTLIKGS